MSISDIERQGLSIRLNSSSFMWLKTLTAIWMTALPWEQKLC